MLINTEGRPAILTPIFENDIDSHLWQHCFGDTLLLDNKKNRAKAYGILAAHGIEANYCQALKKKGK